MQVIEVKPELADEVYGKVKDRVCLVCNSKVDSQSRRGLCTRDYLFYMRTKNALPKSKRRAFEEKQIREGRVLSPQQIRRIRNPNPFTLEVA